MMRNGQYSFLTYLTQSLFALFLLLLSVLLTGVYLFTNKAIEKQQRLSIELNNRNSAKVLDFSLHKLSDNIGQLATLLANYPNPNLDTDHTALLGVIQTGASSSLDMIRFISVTGQQVAKVDSPFYELSNTDLHLTEQSEHYLQDNHLLSVKTAKETLWLLVAGERIVHQASGKMLGILICGIVINDDTPLAREIALRSDAEYAALQIGNRIVCSSKPLPETLRVRAEAMQENMVNVTHQFTEENQEIVISRYAYPMAHGQSLYILHFYKDTLQAQTQRAFLFSGLMLILATVVLFFLFFLLSRRQIVKAMRNLLHYTEQASDPDQKSVYKPGCFIEFNQVGDAVEQMVLQLDNSRNELLNERALLISLMNAMPDLIFYKDQDSIYLGCNNAFELFTGKLEKEIIGKTDFDLFTPEVAELFQKQDKNMLASGQPRRHEAWATYPDGHRVLFDTLKTIFTRSSGQIHGLIGVSRDITEIKQIENQLNDERERLSVTLRSIGDAVMSTDTEGKIFFLNKVAEDLTGWSNEEALGKDSTVVFNIIDEETEEKCVSPVHQVLEQGRIIGLATHTALIAKDGMRKSIADSGAPIRDRNNEVVGVVIVFRDISHELQMEEELLKVKKLESIGVLAGGIAHDFNNILSVILGNIELAGYRIAKDDSKTLALLTRARKATRRASKLTSQLLTFSKGGDPIKGTTSLMELVRDSADFVLHGSKVSCEYSFEDDLWLIHADSGQISQVIQNIIINAKQSMADGGTLTIQCANVKDTATESLLCVDKGNYVRITIKDSGVGIPKKNIDKIFDPYFTTKEKGSGLGLAICHSIIKKHDGYLTVYSIAGKGATFTLYLPASRFKNSRSSSIAKKPKDAPVVKTARIVVMDDKEMLREMAASQLAVLGHEAILVVDGTQAIKKYQELLSRGTPADLVIMDLTIPGGMGGQEAAGKLLQIDPDAKIIVASGYSNDPVMANYQEYGFRAAIAKPYDMKQLNDAIASILS